MPIRDRDDATQVASRFQRFFDAKAEQRPGILRELFTEILDFDRESGRLSLVQAQGRAGIELPDVAERIATLDGVVVLYVDLSSVDTATERVRKAEVLAVTTVVRDALREDMLLLFSNRSGDQFHWIHPKFSGGATPTLRRIVLERGIEQRTAIQQLSNIYWSYRDSGNILDAVNEAFNVDKVTKDFFREYKRIFERAEALIAGFRDVEERKQFVQTLFNRLMFVYFLSRKGWLKYEGETDYLSTLWDAYADHATQDNFYNDRLTFLFFQGLNNPDSRDVRGGVDFLIGDVPFLNGGLFEETEFDRRGNVTVPDEAIRPLMTELFEKFNFTVMESTPFDIEVAVDPEMLGKVFEELVTGRHDSGAYYTPRPVVSFMCREALKGYLEGALTPALSQGEREQTAAAVARFVDDHDASGISISQATAIQQALEVVTVVDPACGSGAYLVGMMQELVDLRVELYNQKLKQDARSLYELKLHIIERNLHGVDLDAFAVNIAMLRLWLSLAIEFEGDQPEPLPNLDFKIVEGDSLLGPDPSQISLDSHAIQQSNLGFLKSAYMRAKTAEEKSPLRQQIEEARQAIRNTLADANVPEGAVDWRIDFAEVITKGGFDIVIANPPYVESRSSSVSPTLKDAYQTRVKEDWNASLPRGSDLLVYFFAQAAHLISQTGSAVFITQNAWLNTDYGYAFQQFTVGRFSFSSIIESDGKFFDSSSGPMVNAIICFFSKQPQGRVDYKIADRSLNVTKLKSIAADNSYKWGTLFAMPDSLGKALSVLDGTITTEIDLQYGQGLNFPKRELNCETCKTPLLMGHGEFAALAADARGPAVGQKRARRIPALIMPRGIGDRYFCTFNACRAFSWSGVDVYLPDSLWLTDIHYCLWLYLNSSLAWLFREVTGRKNLGGGMLKAEATDMKRLPIRFAYDFGTDARQVYEDLQKRTSLPVREELVTKEHLRIDQIVGEFFGIGNEMPYLRDDLVRLVKFRSDRASSHKLQVPRS